MGVSDEFQGIPQNREDRLLMWRVFLFVALVLGCLGFLAGPMGLVLFIPAVVLLMSKELFLTS